MEDTLQDALKAQTSLLPRRKAVEWLCITSYKMMMHMILSTPLSSNCDFHCASRKLAVPIRFQNVVTWQ